MKITQKLSSGLILKGLFLPVALKGAFTILERVNVLLIIFLNYLIPKHKVNKRVLVFCDMGIGDLIMFMPVIKVLIESRYELTLMSRKQVNLDILIKHFPGCLNEPSGAYGWSLNNFHTTHKRYVLEILKRRIPNRVGHSWNKWKGFFNMGVKFDINSGYQPDKNLELCYKFIKTDIPIIEKMFFNYDPVEGFDGNYVAMQLFSHTDPRKEVDIIPKFFVGKIILLGSGLYELSKNNKLQMKLVKQGYEVINLCNLTNIFETAYIIKCATYFFAIESGLVHLASIYGTHTVVFYHEGVSNKHVFHKNINYQSV